MSKPAQPKVKYIVFSIVCLFAAYNFTRTTLDILQSSKRLDTLKSDVAILEGTKADLNNTVAYKQTPEYVEEQARNTLNLVKPGEKVFVVPQVLGKSTDGNVDDGNGATQKLVNNNNGKSNIQLWLELFL